MITTPRRTGLPQPGEQDYHPGEQDYHPGEQDYHPGEQDYHPGEQDYHAGEQDYHPGEQDFHTLTMPAWPRGGREKISDTISQCSYLYM